jgi:hypothetical protein
MDFDEEGMAAIAGLQNTTGLKTYKDLFNNALTLLDWAIQQKRAGRVIASLDETSKDYRELQMPALERAAKPAVAAAARVPFEHA